MNNVRQLIFPGAILGSLLLASFGYSVMARVPNLSTAAVQKNDATAMENISASNQLTAENGDSKQSMPDTQKCSVNPSFPADVRQWCSQIMRHASKNNLDPNLIAAIIWQESGGNPGAYSKSGAVGLMQVMPRDGIAASFQCINGPCFTNRPTIAELEKPNFNIKYGTGMIAGLMTKHGDLRDALKSYGPMNVGYYYADKVISIYNANSG
jgi:soluble lytic murein transglycosylase-like protein